MHNRNWRTKCPAGWAAAALLDGGARRRHIVDWQQHGGEEREGCAGFAAEQFPDHARRSAADKPQVRKSWTGDTGWP